MTTTRSQLLTPVRARRRRAPLARASAAAILFAWLAWTSARPAHGTPPGATFAARRAAHPTKLTREMAPPQPYTPQKPPPGVREVTYPSSVGALKAWFALPARHAGRVPAVVHFHGGFAFARGDWDEAKPFLAAGFAVMAPMLRGENGNPGHFEAFWGEVDDARAAVAWVAKQPSIDPARIYAFGHSAGGIISALLSLYDDPQPALTGSVGGLMGEDLFAWLDPPFDRRDENEWSTRVLWPNLDVMRKRHVGYVGSADEGCRHALPDLLRGLQKVKAPLEIVGVPGDHLGSKPIAIKKFVELLRKLR